MGRTWSCSFSSMIEVMRTLSASFRAVAELSDGSVLNDSAPSSVVGEEGLEVTSGGLIGIIVGLRKSELDSLWLEGC